MESTTKEQTTTPLTEPELLVGLLGPWALQPRELEALPTASRQRMARVLEDPAAAAALWTQHKAELMAYAARKECRPLRGWSGYFAEMAANGAVNQQPTQ